MTSSNNSKECCEKCLKCPDYPDAKHPYCHHKECNCHQPTSVQSEEEWHEEWKALVEQMFNQEGHSLNFDEDLVVEFITKLRAEAFEEGVTLLLKMKPGESVVNLIRMAEERGRAKALEEVLSNMNTLLANYSVDRPCPPAAVRYIIESLQSSNDTRDLPNQQN